MTSLNHYLLSANFCSMVASYQSKLCKLLVLSRTFLILIPTFFSIPYFLSHTIFFLYLRSSVFWAIFNFWLSTSIFTYAFLLFQLILPFPLILLFLNQSFSFLAYSQILQLLDVGCLGRNSEYSNILNSL